MPPKAEVCALFIEGGDKLCYNSKNKQKRFQEKKMAQKTLLFVNKICTIVFYPAFAALLLWLWQTDHPDFLRTLFTCALSFGLLSVYRRWRNAPRPYETDPTIEPPTPHCRKGHSFPSRHVFSAWVITATFFYFSPLLGTILAIPATALAYLRQRLHFHHKRDVIWGAALGILCAVVGLWVV